MLLGLLLPIGIEYSHRCRHRAPLLLRDEFLALVRLIRKLAKLIPAWAFWWRNDNLRVVDLNNVTTISTHAFYNCQSLERVVRSAASAVEIGVQAFASCNSLREIDLSNVTKIGEDAFAHSGLKQVTILPGTEVGAGAFRECHGLVNVELGGGIKHIGKSAFKGCSRLVRITVPASVSDIGNEAFCGCNSLEDIQLNEGLQHIGTGAFQRCKSLQSITIPSSTVKVGSGAFADCHQLREAELREGLQMIGIGAFRSCRSLERVAIPSSATLIGARAFGKCRSLSEVTLREGLHYIEGDAFIYCASLRHISIPPVALVVDVRDRRCQLIRTTTLPIGREREKRLVVSTWMQYKSQSQLAQAGAKIDEILTRRRQPGARGWQSENQKEKIQSIRDWFADYYDLVEVTTMLELAIWRVNMNGNENSSEVRQTIRRNRGNDMNIIIPGVLPYLKQLG